MKNRAVWSNKINLEVINIKSISVQGLATQVFKALKISLCQSCRTRLRTAMLRARANLTDIQLMFMKYKFTLYANKVCSSRPKE